jgi:leucyl-tRNA synthetase
MPVDHYIGGAEHAVLHLLYARFWHKVLFDAGLVSTPEPFQKLFNNGMVLGITYRTREGRIIPYDQIKFVGEKAVHAETGEPLEGATEKMSKSRGNVINPDAVVAEHGADTVRLYEMFMGPLDATKPWSAQDVPGVHRFLGRVWRLFVAEDGNVRPNLRQDNGSLQLEHALQRCIKKVTQDIEALAMNTAISAMMIFVNEATRVPEQLGKSQAERFVLALAPFAPHISEELWQRLGHDGTITYERWPAWDEKLLREEDIVVPVQVNGKLRARLTVPPTTTDDELRQKALADETIQKMLQGKPPRKIIVVPGKLVNIVIA